MDGRQFLSLVQRLELTGELLDRLAAAAYHIYRTSLERQNPTLAAERLPYADLSEEEKEQNRQVVRDTPAKLAAAGYVMRPVRSDEPAFDFPDGDREQLAEMEHDRWLKARLAAGWRYAEQTDPAGKTHAVLLPWHTLSQAKRIERYGEAGDQALGVTELSESEREKNRAFIDGIPLILAQAGYTPIKVRGHGHG